ncbi:hypothetical protein Slin15195_G043320 [Septoria linicola]|uniref:Uncharacterized protein n=1 Tax=Septoria linicola TaxID=215465 RepID=A0A9Q9ARU9_9PEZI|nr:hypothetical protein Slin15195_G043320 [Septoria linicola]
MSLGILKVLACVSIALQLYELIDQVDVASLPFQAHMNGAMELLEACGPASFTSPAYQQVFCGFRSFLTGYALAQRQPCFLSEHAWLHVPFLGRRKTVRDRLLDVAVRIPSLLRRVDSLMATANLQQSSSPADMTASVQTVLIELAEVDQKVQSWQRSADIDYSTFRSRPRLQSHVPPSSTIPKSGFVGPRYFPMPPIAGLYVHGWCHRLELYISSTSLRRVVLEHEWVLPDETRDMTIQRLTADEDLAAEVAACALEASALPLTTLEGHTALQFPLKVIGRFFAQRTEPSPGARHDQRS